MKSSMAETENEKCSEYVSVKFLLKQVYAAHTAKVKELESEIKNLKQQLEESARLVASSNSECERCKQQETAAAGYKNEEEKLNRFNVCSQKDESSKDSATSDCASDLEVIEETMMDVGNEHYVCEVEGTPRKASGRAKDNLMSSKGLSSWLVPAAKQEAKLAKDVLDTTPLHDEAILVPDTLEEVLGVQKCLETKESPAVGNRKCRSFGDTPNQGKENQGISNEMKGKAMNSKKRALSELALNEVLASNKKLNGKLKESQQLPKKQEVLNVEQSVMPISSNNNKNMKNILSSDPSDKWAELYHDFKNSSSELNHLGTSKTNKPTGDEEEDDFVVKNSEDNAWKSSVKKNCFKKSVPVKAIKCTSRFKMTLEAPDLNAKKVNYKQTTLPMSCFVSSKTVGKDSDSDVIVDSDGSESNKAVEASSVADVSQLARLAGSSSTTCLSGRSCDQTPSPVAEATHASILSETLCPLGLIAKNMPQQEQDEDIFVVDCIGGASLKDDELENNEVEQNCDSFDRVPVESEPNYKYKEDVVRNKSKRKQLDGFDCKECEKYYSELGISEEEKRKRMKNCSRHRAKFMPPSTPAHFWELEFPDTEECKARGYIAETQKVKLTSRRRRPLNKE